MSVFKERQNQNQWSSKATPSMLSHQKVGALDTLIPVSAHTCVSKDKNDNIWQQEQLESAASL